MPSQKKHVSMKSIFLDGLFALIPSVVTIYSVVWVVQLIRTHVLIEIVDLMPEYYQYLWYNSMIAEAAAFFLLLITIFIIGLIARSVIGLFFQRTIHNSLTKFPFIGGLYKGITEIIQLVSSTNSTQPDATHFSRTCLVSIGGPHSKKSIGFITSSQTQHFVGQTAEPYYLVFVPSTPLPTTGFTFLVPKTEVTLLDITPEHAFKVLMSAGVLSQ